MKTLNSSLILTTGVILLMVLLALSVIHIFRISYPISVVNSNTSSELSVVGEGKVEVIPDIATVDVGISITNGANVTDVRKNIDETNNKIVAAMTQLGIKRPDIKSQNYSIFPNYVYENNQDTQRGYNGNVTISIKVRNVALVSRVMEEATKAGANQVQGTQYSVENPNKYREEAREKAIANAKDQAQKLAKNLGIKLGKVTNIVESSGASDAPMYAMREQALGGGSANLQPGSQSITSVVTLYFEKN